MYRSAVKQFETSGTWGESVKEIMACGLKPKKGVDMGDHPPITPVRVVDPHTLGGLEGRLYEIITDYFLASVSEDCKYKTTTVKFDIGGESFECSGRKVISAGFTSILNRKKVDDVDMPPFIVVYIYINYYYLFIK